MTEDDDVHFAKSRELAEKVHEADPEIILQACIFECVTQRMESVKIPEFVFRDFGMEPKDRCFCLADTVSRRTGGICKPQRGAGEEWGNPGSEPAGGQNVVLLPGSALY